MYHRLTSRKGFAITSLILITSLFGTNTVWAAGGSGGGGGGGVGGSSTAKPKSPEHVASSSYRSGIRHKERAWRFEDKAAKAKNEKKRTSLLAKAQREYVKAKDKQGTVLQIQPRNHEAANELGYALRKSGDVQRAIGAYNYALELKPDFLQAVEYRAEAYLSLGFLDETKSSYMRLFREDEALAAQLMNAITQWLNAKSEATEAVEDFGRWASERQRLVSFTPSNEAASEWR
jgi:tetratricopeptide (TPR) repeat protein